MLEGGGEGAKGGSLKTDMTTIDGLRAAGGEKGGGLEHFVESLARGGLTRARAAQLHNCSVT